MLRSKTVHTIRDLFNQGHSIRAIAAEVGIARNTVRKYLRGTPDAAPRPRRASKLDPFKDQVRRWVQEDRLLNCQTMFERLQAGGYMGSYSTLKAFVQPLRPRDQGSAPFAATKPDPASNSRLTGASLSTNKMARYASCMASRRCSAIHGCGLCALPSAVIRPA